MLKIPMDICRNINYGSDNKDSFNQKKKIVFYHFSVLFFFCIITYNVSTSVCYIYQNDSLYTTILHRYDKIGITGLYFPPVLLMNEFFIFEQTLVLLIEVNN